MIVPSTSFTKLATLCLIAVHSVPNLSEAAALPSSSSTLGRRDGHLAKPHREQTPLLPLPPAAAAAAKYKAKNSADDGEPHRKKHKFRKGNTHHKAVRSIYFFSREKSYRRLTRSV
jgi:hypothetical protein